ncbi:YebC/PmpR family DNA-binding transcriptional regulator [Sporolactobacillus terrae]|uniref:Probable transcriptional regulatory protein C0674_09915 n=1 Tax=Sporolactobacillus terrae TaxID=269673 RepID=A0ABX5QBM0_9BACL|nr:YebC/PmpR family DNA-binding transcriptional regulator [Sporolactobacillus terrae]QAA24055.1 YebC/PmpR family DNA-binding transcriptional regulator [Sporolactobacillus terrae]QAA27024.1 YebC/PmpR family DNA-binding transcriptional regulator [Sporolactobacillus terrae]UAK17760.1 YebC/PmpR family DNA-binding transcriptional regulator [Sporolactobacillus terrae]
MSGHSKWNNIQHKKNAVDAARGKIFMRLSKDIFLEARHGGGDPSMNSGLRHAIEKAKAANMPNDNISRAIKKATGDLDGVTYEEITYEGYGPGGVAVMVDVLTDNRNRSASDIRHAFTKSGGNLGESGSVGFLFDKQGIIEIEKNDELDEDTVMMDAIDAGAEDMKTQDDRFIIITTPDVFEDVRKTLSEDKGYEVDRAEVAMIPTTKTALTGNDLEKMKTLIEVLEDNDDVQDIYTNLEEND